MKMGPQRNLGAESQSHGTIQLVPKSWKMAIIIPKIIIILIKKNKETIQKLHQNTISRKLIAVPGV